MNIEVCIVLNSCATFHTTLSSTEGMIFGFAVGDVNSNLPFGN